MPRSATQSHAFAAYFEDAADPHASTSSRSRPEMRAHATSVARSFTHYLKRPAERLAPVCLGATVGTVLVLAWLWRGEGRMTPEEGLGYWLGIVGALMMLLLLLYPLRKHFRALGFLGGVKGWFRLHMLFGIVGPAMILVHSNFQFNSVNATVATVAMLIVVLSGLVGRYLYARIHLGLYGRRAKAKELIEDVETLKSILGSAIAHNPQFMAELARLGRLLPEQHAHPLQSTIMLLTIGPRSRSATRRLQSLAQSIIREEARHSSWSWMARRKRLAEARQHIALFRSALVKSATLSFYGQLFSLWHVLHMPLFLLLIVTAVIHVIAVHLY